MKAELKMARKVVKEYIDNGKKIADGHEYLRLCEENGFTITDLQNAIDYYRFRGKGQRTEVF